MYFSILCCYDYIIKKEELVELHVEGHWLLAMGMRQQHVPKMAQTLMLPQLEFECVLNSGKYHYC